MSLKIDQDHSRFRAIVRGKIRENLKKYISHGELIGRKGKDLVSIPIPQIDIPRFRFGEKQSGGTGQGDGEPGDPLGGQEQEGDGTGKAGKDPGDHQLEVDVTLEELAAILGEELALPDIENRGKSKIINAKDRFTGIRRVGPESLRHFKRTYREALKRNADIVIMLHPDYQYPPKLVPAMASLIATGMFDVVLGSRILGGYALKGGMPFYKYVANRLLTAFENIVTGQKLSEYHTGFRAYSREALKRVCFERNSNDFIFDNQMLTQFFYFGYRIGEISAPCSYNKDCSSISFRRSVSYGLGVLATSVRFFLAKYRITRDPLFDAKKA